MKHKICFILFILLVLFNAYDVYSTNTLLNSGVGFYEANPIVAFIMDMLGQLTGMIVFKTVALVLLGSFLFRANTKRTWNALIVGLLISTLAYGGAMYFLNYKSMIFLENLGV